MDTVIFDIDGVLADNSNFSSWYDETGDFLADNFAKEISSMKVNRWADMLLSCMSDYYKIVLITARRKAFKKATLEWLEKNYIVYDKVYFNEEKEDHVKHKLKAAKKCKDVLFIVEDSPELVKAYREAGYVVLQPNHLYGDD
jgi:uncharacterized HAD superfamily protein